MECKCEVEENNIFFVCGVGGWGQLCGILWACLGCILSVYQDNHGQFLAGKAATVVATSAACCRHRCCCHFLFCKIQARSRTLGALPAVAALCMLGDKNIHTIFKVGSLLIYVEYAYQAHFFYWLGPNNDLIMGAT